MADPIDRDDDGDVPDGPDYLWDGSGAPDPEVARLERLLAPLAHAGAPPELPAEVVPIARARRRRWPIAAAALVAAAAAVIALVLVRRRGAGADGCDRGAGFAFSADAAVRCTGGTGARGTLAVGGWIETADGTARVEVANIGAVELAPRSRLALRGTSAAEHRLALEHGALHARVTARPRLFVIETPSATAIDLGCEYDLSVGPDGTGTLSVVTGQVELAAPGGALVVSAAGTRVQFTPRGVGLPVRTGAGPAMIAAAAGFDPARPRTVTAILSIAGDGDQITLVNLLALAGPYQREAIYAALFELSPTPEDVLEDAIIAGDPDALARWRESVVDGWMISPWSANPAPLTPTPPTPTPTPPAPTPPAPTPRPPTTPPAPTTPTPMPPDKAPDPTGWAPQ